jgi:Flp pilus assembly pilin Flp
MRKKWLTFAADTRGDTGFVEWLALVVLISVGCITIFQTIGMGLSDAANAASDQIQTIAGGGGGP